MFLWVQGTVGFTPRKLSEGRATAWLNLVTHKCEGSYFSTWQSEAKLNHLKMSRWKLRASARAAGHTAWITLLIALKSGIIFQTTFDSDFENIKWQHREAKNWIPSWGHRLSSNRRDARAPEYQGRYDVYWTGLGPGNAELLPGSGDTGF